MLYLEKLARLNLYIFILLSKNKWLINLSANFYLKGFKN